MTRRLLPLVVSAGLLVGSAVVAPSAAADADQDQVLDLSAVPLTQHVGTPWAPPPIRSGAPALALTASPTPADACQVTGDTITFALAGTCSVTATAPAYSGYKVSNTVPLTFTVEGYPTTTTIAAHPAGPLVGDPSTLRATVDSGSHGRPAGTMTFVRLGADDAVSTDDTVVASGVALTDGSSATTSVAEYAVPTTDATATRYAATFVPSSPTALAGSTSTTPASVTAVRRDVHVAVTLTRSAVAAGAPVEVTVRATEGAGGTGTVVDPATSGGTILLDGATSTGTVTWTAGTTTHTFTAPTTVGTHTVDVSFVAADADRYASPVAADPVTLTVGAATTTALVVGASPRVGDPLSLTATVDSQGHGTPTGSVRFFRRGSSTPVDTRTLPAGTGDTVSVAGSVTPADADPQDYYARYVPTDPAVLAGSDSPDQAATVARRDVDVAFSVPSTVVLRGATLSVTATATDAHVPATTVAARAAASSITINGADVATSWSGNVGTATLPTATAGTYDVGVTFVAQQDGTYRQPTVTTQRYVVVDPTTTVLSAPTTTQIDDDLVLTATVSSNSHGVPAGTVRFYRRGTATPLGSASLAAAGTDSATATWTVIHADTTSRDYWAIYDPATTPAPQAHATSTAADRSVAAVRRAITVTATPATDPTAVGDPVTIALTATDRDDPTTRLQPTAGSGKVTINGSTPLSPTWTDGAATLTYTPTTTGTQNVTVAFTPTSAKHASVSAAPSSFTAKLKQTPTGAVPAGTHYAGHSVTPVISNGFGAVTLTPRTATCTVAANGTDLVLVRATTCQVDFTTAGDGTHLPGAGTFSLTVTPRPVAVDVQVAPRTTPYGVDVAISATATETAPLTPGDTSTRAGTGVVTVERVTPGPRTTVLSNAAYTYGGTPVSLVRPEPGTYEVTVSFVAADTGVLAGPAGTGALDVTKIVQTLTFGTPTARQLHVGEVWPAPATNSVPGDAFTPVLGVRTPSGQPAACEVTDDGTGIRFLRAADCIVTASRPDQPRYQAAYEEKTVRAQLRPVQLTAVTTTTDPVDDVPRYQGPARVTVTATDGLDGTTVAVEGSGTVRIVGYDDPAATPVVLGFPGGVDSRTLTPQALGDLDVLVAFTPDLDEHGIERWATTTADPDHPTTTLTVERGRQHLLWGADDDAEHDGSAPVDTRRDTRVVSDAGLSGITLRDDSTDADTCSVSGLEIRFDAATATPCVVTARQGGTTLWLPQERSQSITVTRRPVDVTVTWPAGPHPYGTPVPITVTITDRLAAGPVPDAGSTTRSGDGVLSVGDDRLPLVFHDGEAVALYDPAGVATYAVSATFDPDRDRTYQVFPEAARDLTTVIGSQDIRFATAAPAAPNKRDTWVPGASGGGSRNPIVMTVTPSSVCRAANPGDDLAGPGVVFTGLGTCVVDFHQDGVSGRYTAGEREVRIGVVRIGVTLAIGVPDTATTYATATAVTVRATTSRPSTLSVPGPVTIDVVDTTARPGFDPATDAIDPADVVLSTTADITATDVAAPGAVVSLAVPAKTLLAGTYWVRVHHVPTDTEYDDPTRYATFTVQLAPQTAVPTSTAPSPGYVSRAWTPTFAATPSGLPVLLTAAAANPPVLPVGASTMPAGTPSATCVTASAGRALSFTAEGTCRATAAVAGVARRYAASPAADLEVPVSRLPVRIDLDVLPTPRTDADPLGGPVVDGLVEVHAVARDVLDRPVAGGGPLTVAGVTTDPAAGWRGGGLYYSYLPTAAGTYAVSGSFTPTSQVTYRLPDAASASYTVSKAQQTVRLTTPQPATATVRQSWTPRASGGASGNPVLPVVDASSTRLPVDDGEPAPADPYVCKVTGAVVSFEGAGTCVVRLRQAGTATGYEEGHDGPYSVTVTQTDAAVTLEGPASAQVGVPVTVVARATAGTGAGARGVAGTGDIVITHGTDAIATGTAPWVDGVKRMTWIPTTAGADMSVAVSFRPTDGAAYRVTSTSDPQLVDVATGSQSIVLDQDRPASSTAWVAETWTPGARLVRYGVTTTAIAPVSTTPAVCTVSGGQVRFDAAGTCTVQMTRAEEPGPYTRVTWPARSETRTVVVAAHPVDVELRLPAATQLLASRQIPVTVLVQGRRAGGTSSELVTGSLVLTLDGRPLDAAGDVATGPGQVYPVTTGTVSGLVRVRLDGGETPSADGSYAHRIGARFTPNPVPLAGFWAEGTDREDVAILLNRQQIQTDLRIPDRVPVGASWRPAPTTDPAGRTVTTTLPGTAGGSCRLDDGVLRVTSSQVDEATLDDDTTPDPTRQCSLSYHQAGDLEYAAADRGQGFTPVLRTPTVTLTDRSTKVGRPITLGASVQAPAWPATPISGVSGVAAEFPEGTVTFTVTTPGRTPETLDPVPVGADGRASASYLPETAVDRRVTAVFTPAAEVASEFSAVPTADDPAPGADLTVAPVTTTTQIDMGRTAITAIVRSDGTEATPVTGLVTFTATSLDTQETRTLAVPVAVGAGGVARLTTDLPGRTERVIVTASYAGDAHHVRSQNIYTRLLPTITTSTPPATWQSGPVRVSFTCTPASADPRAGLGGRCPAPATVSGEGAGQSVFGEVTADDGGYASVRTGGIRIDRTRPTVAVRGTAQGGWYQGAAPAATCRGADRLSGLATCRVTRSRVNGRVQRDVAIATDRAGNTSRAAVTYEVRQEWVDKAPLVRSGFQVRRGTKQRIIARTDGAQPQLMLPGRRGWTAGKVFRARRIDEGVVTWYVDVTVPASVRVGRSWTVGFRLAGAPDDVATLRLDVVRKPSSGGRARR